jgi:predicted amidohydrolase
MIISCVIAQFPVSLSILRNLDRIDSLLAQTRAGDLVLFPEGAISGYSPETSFLQRIQPAELNAAIEHLQKAAQDRNIHIWAGACIPKKDQWFNTAIGFSPDGSRQVYTKINLANHERGFFSTGDQLPVFEYMVPGGKVKIGVQICRELRFPEQWGLLARRGAQIILHLNNAVGAAEFQPVWRSHLVSRAAETQRFVLSANNAAPDQTSPTLAVAPDGQILGEIVSATTGLLRVELDLSRTSNWYLDQCRTDVVEITTSKYGGSD